VWVTRAHCHRLTVGFKRRSSSRAEIAREIAFAGVPLDAAN
jgi:hypothetical protein